MWPDATGYGHRLSAHEIAAGLPNEGGFDSFGAAIYLMTVDRTNSYGESNVCGGGVEYDPILNELR